MRPTLVLHGGAMTEPDLRAAVLAAGEAALPTLRAEGAVAGVVEAVRRLEDDGRFNAGAGSLPRVDGRTVEMDAAVMTSDLAFGAVAGLRGFRNPVLAARKVLETPHNVLLGEGAARLASAMGLTRFEGPTPEARRVADGLRDRAVELGHQPDTGWALSSLREAWNYPQPPPWETDTVGAVAWDGTGYAAAASTGGLSVSLMGRMSDVPVPGGALYVGPRGAVALTGHGEHIARHLLGHRAYLGLESGRVAADALRAILGQVPESVAIGLVAVGPGGAAGASNRSMPWVALEA